MFSKCTVTKNLNQTKPETSTKVNPPERFPVKTKLLQLRINVSGFKCHAQWHLSAGSLIPTEPLSEMKTADGAE